MPVVQTEGLLEGHDLHFVPLPRSGVKKLRKEFQLPLCSWSVVFLQERRGKPTINKLACFSFQSASVSLKIGENEFGLSNSLDLAEKPSYSAYHPDPSCLHMVLWLCLVGKWLMQYYSICHTSLLYATATFICISIIYMYLQKHTVFQRFCRCCSVIVYVPTTAYK